MRANVKLFRVLSENLRDTGSVFIAVSFVFWAKVVCCDEIYLLAPDDHSVERDGKVTFLLVTVTMPLENIRLNFCI